MAFLMALENFILITMIFYKELSFMEGVKAKADLLSLMEVIMMEILKIMSLMDMAFMLAKKDFDIKANGRIMFLMVQEKQPTLMDLDM
mgnify:FL=1